MTQIFIELINSFHRHGPDEYDDHLEDFNWLNMMTTKWGSTPLATKAENNRLRQLRDLLRKAVNELIETSTLSDRTIVNLNEYIGVIKQNLIIERDENGGVHVVERPTTTLKPSFIVAHDFAKFLSQGNAHRIKFCQNDRCQLAFIDGTKNKSKKWCESRACGNLSKVRAFRARKKDEQLKNG